MRRKETEELEKRVVNFYKGDFGKLQDLHPRIGASKAIRLLAREHIRRAEAQAAQNATPVTAAPLEEPLE